MTCIPRLFLLRACWPSLKALTRGDESGRSASEGAGAVRAHDRGQGGAICKQQRKAYGGGWLSKARDRETDDTRRGLDPSGRVLHQAMGQINTKSACPSRAWGQSGDISKNLKRLFL